MIRAQSSMSVVVTGQFHREFLFYYPASQLLSSSLWSHCNCVLLSGRFSKSDRLHPLLPALPRPPPEPQVEQLQHRLSLLLPLLLRPAAHLPVHKAGTSSPILRPAGESVGCRGNARLPKRERATNCCASALSVIVQGEAAGPVLACPRALTRQTGRAQVRQLSGHYCFWPEKFTLSWP